MHPNSILSIIPPNKLDNEISRLKPKRLNIFVDVKNACTSLFIDEVMKEIVHESRSQRSFSSCILQSFLTFSVFWKRFALKKKLDFNICFCSDDGPSTYHIEIDKNYKKSRKIGSVDLPDYYEELFSIRRKNIALGEKICNRLPNVYFFLLKYLESDFLPHYLIKHYYKGEDNLNVVISNDKDMYQTIITDNVFMIYKSRSVTYMLNKKTVLGHYTQINKSTQKVKEKWMNDISNFNLEYFDVLMAIVGDSGDDVPGISGVGPKKSLELFKDKALIKTLIGEHQNLVNRIMTNDGSFFCDNIDYSDSEISNKLSKQVLWKKVIENKDLVTRAFKLISFEALCKWVNNLSLGRHNYKTYIESILSKEQFQIVDSNSIISVLDNLEDLSFTSENVKILYV